MNFDDKIYTLCKIKEDGKIHLVRTDRIVQKTFCGISEYKADFESFEGTLRVVNCQVCRARIEKEIRLLKKRNKSRKMSFLSIDRIHK